MLPPPPNPFTPSVVASRKGLMVHRLWGRWGLMPASGDEWDCLQPVGESGVGKSTSKPVKTNDGHDYLSENATLDPGYLQKPHVAMGLRLTRSPVPGGELTKFLASKQLEGHMKRSLSSTLLCFFFSSLSMNIIFAQTVPQPDVQGLDKKVFIGQAYPSGNVYLECFSDKKTDCIQLWPKELIILPLGDAGSVLGKTQMNASFVKIMKDGLRKNVGLSTYIPGIEGMDKDQHGSCGLGESKSVDQYKYISETSDDYFYAMPDYCESSEGIGVYRAAGSKYSFLVLGIDPGVAVAGLKALSGKRPLTAADQQEIAKEKMTDKEAEAGPACTTNPAYIDSATQVAEISLADGDLRLRLSTYDNPGCHGHLANIYVLDVLQHNALLRKLEVYRTLGVL